MKTHCKRGHPRTPDTVDSNGYCKMCNNQRVCAWQKLNHTKTRAKAKRLVAKDPAKHRENGKRWDSKNPDKRKAMRRKDLAKPYGLSAEEYDALLLKQAGKCALCSLPFYEGKAGQPVLDHNHSTNKLREFLHGKCNLALGGFGDSLSVCRLAVEYLEKHMKGENA